jgi:hypothetical protein
MGSPVSGRALGECNAITSPGFGPSGLTLYAAWKPRLARSALQGLLLGRNDPRRGVSKRWWGRYDCWPHAAREADTDVSATGVRNRTRMIKIGPESIINDFKMLAPLPRRSLTVHLEGHRFSVDRCFFDVPHLPAAESAIPFQRSGGRSATNPCYRRIR